MRVNIIFTILLTISVVDSSLGHPQVDQQASEQTLTQDQQIREGKAIANNGFPSISTFLNTDSFDSLRTPQADLSPTNFFSAERFNSFDSLSGLPQPNLKEPEIVGITPASFSLPQFPRNLDEPEIVGRDPALFSSVPGSDPNLFSTAASVINALSASSDGKTNNDVSTDEPNQGGSETQELNLQPNGRYRRSDLIFWKNLALFRNHQLKSHKMMNL